MNIYNLWRNINFPQGLVKSEGGDSVPTIFNILKRWSPATALAGGIDIIHRRGDCGSLKGKRVAPLLCRAYI